MMLKTHTDPAHKFLDWLGCCVLIVVPLAVAAVLLPLLLTGGLS